MCRSRNHSALNHEEEVPCSHEWTVQTRNPASMPVLGSVPHITGALCSRSRSNVQPGVYTLMALS